MHSTCKVNVTRILVPWCCSYDVIAIYNNYDCVFYILDFEIMHDGDQREMVQVAP
jgi:hypothetical protein